LGGGETDEITSGCHVPPVTPLLHYSGAPLSNGTPVSGDAVRYTACSGAEVFSGGSLQFSWGLDPWRDPSYGAPGLAPVPPAIPALQRAMTNALADLTHSHVPVPGPPHICVPTVGITGAPVSWAAVGQRVHFESTATDQYGTISSQQWNVSWGGGSATASGPALTRTFWRPGPVTVGLTVADASGATATGTATLQVCPCPAPDRHVVAYPPGAQSGPPCQLMGLGTLQALGHGLAFSANASIKRVTITTYRVMVRRHRIRLARVTVSSLASLARASGPVAVPQIGASMLVEVTARAGGRLWRERFLVPGGRGAQPGVVSEALCDGTSGHVLTPVFRGPRSLPLRVAVSGPGRVTVWLRRVGGGASYRRVVISRRRTVLVSFSVARVRRGVYRVTVVAARSHLPQAVQLTALAL
jgi:hypothetical protein